MFVCERERERERKRERECRYRKGKRGEKERHIIPRCQFLIEAGVAME